MPRTRPTEVSFAATPADVQLVGKIVDRALGLYRQHGVKADRMALQMNLLATHANGNPMDFAKLLAADDFNLMHDVGGIAHHLDRSTGQLTGHFSPRCSARQTVEA